MLHSTTNQPSTSSAHIYRSQTTRGLHRSGTKISDLILISALYRLPHRADDYVMRHHYTAIGRTIKIISAFM